MDKSFFSDEKISEKLEKRGYELRSQENEYVRRDKLNEEGIVTHCLHLSMNERDDMVEIFLRSNDGKEFLEKYDSLKRHLVSIHNISMVDYRDSKQSLLREIRVEALKFSQQSK